jgi:hypothetical protein
MPKSALGPVGGRASESVRFYLARGKKRSDPLNEEWPAQVEIQLSHRSNRATFVAIQSRDPDSLSPSDLQRFPWATMFAAADAANRGLSDRQPNSSSTEVMGILKAHGEGKLKRPRPPRVAKRPGRRGHPDEHFRAVADRYNELRSSGVSNPTATIARERNASRDTVAGWVRGARDRDYLPPARPGRAG